MITNLFIFCENTYLAQDSLYITAISLSLELRLEIFNVPLITRLNKNIKKTIDPIVVDKLLARKQTIIDSIVDQLKILSIEHTCHRITVNCIINLAGLIAYFAYLSL